MNTVRMFVSFVVMCGVTFAEETPDAARYAQAFAGRQPHRLQFLQQQSKNRIDLTQAILSTLRSATNAEIREHAAKIAGEMRLSGVVETLLPRLSEITVLPITVRVPEIVWPYYGALLHIGSPASERAITLLKGGEDDRTSELLAMLLDGIDSPAIAAFRVERAPNDATEKPEVQKTLKAIQAKLKVITPAK